MEALTDRRILISQGEPHYRCAAALFCPRFAPERL